MCVCVCARVHKSVWLLLLLLNTYVCEHVVYFITCVFPLLCNSQVTVNQLLMRSCRKMITVCVMIMLLMMMLLW